MGKEIDQPYCLIPVCWNLSWKVEIVVLKWLITKGQNSEDQESSVCVCVCVSAHIFFQFFATEIVLSLFSEIDRQTERVLSE
jgi:hypothetical protein